jgi:hypothetical protein
MIVSGNDDHLFNYTDREDKQDVPLVAGAAPFGHTDSSKFEQMGAVWPFVSFHISLITSLPEYADAPTKNRAGVLDTQPVEPWSKHADSPRYPLEQRIEDKRRGIGRQRYPFVTWTLTGLSSTQVISRVLTIGPLAVMIGVFIYESVVNWRAQGTPFSFHVSAVAALGAVDFIDATFSLL